MKTSFKFFASLAMVLFAGIAMASQLDWNVIQSMTSILPQNANQITYAVGTVVTGGVVTQQAVTGDPTGAGTLATETTEYLDMKDVEREVLLYKPYQTPLLTFISANGVGTTDSWEHKYYAIDARGMSTTIVAVDTTLTSNVIVLEVADSSIFTLDNLVFFTSITTATTKVGSGRFLVGTITAFPSTNHITVQLINYGNGNADGDFTNGMLIYRGPTATHESSASTTPWGAYPAYDYNFIQLFQEQVQMSEIQELMKKEANWNFGDLKRMAIEDFKIQRERAFLAGIRGQYNTTVSNKVRRHYTCQGILNDSLVPYKASQTLASLGSDTIVGWLKDIFTGNNGSRTRIFLGGADMIEAIEKIKVDNKWITAKESSIVMGIDTVKMVSTFGSLEMLYYEQLDLLGMEKYGLVIDKANLKPIDLTGRGFQIRDLDLKSAGLSSDKASVIEQASTLCVKNKNTHHIIQGV